MDRTGRIKKLRRARLYGILDMEYVAETEMGRVAEALLAGGVGVLQLRAKGYDAEGVLRLLQEVAPHITGICRSHGVPLVINDFPEIAMAAGADGVHIGQNDGSLEKAREIVGGDMLVGRSTHSRWQTEEALDEGFDYIGFGPLFPTPTKRGRPGIGLENIAGVQRDVGSKIPVFCIGGIHPENLGLVLASGAHRVAIVSALLRTKDITKTTRSVLATLHIKY